MVEVRNHRGSIKWSNPSGVPSQCLCGQWEYSDGMTMLEESFLELERRMDAVEKAIVEIQTLVKILKPIAILLGLGVGMDLGPYFL